MKPLTFRQRRFVAEFVKDMKGPKAAIRAGYSSATADSQASRLLKKPRVRREIESELERRALDADLKPTDIIRELKAMANLDISQAFGEDGAMLPLHEMPADVKRAIAAVETSELFGYAPGEEGKTQIGHIRKLKFWPKDKALELLGKYLKMFTDRVEHQGDVRILVTDPYSQPPGQGEGKVAAGASDQPIADYATAPEAADKEKPT